MANITDERGYNQIFAASPAQAIRLRRRAQAIINELPVPDSVNPRRILELGCGTGELAHTLATLTESHVTGVDLSERFISEAKAAYQRSNLDFLVTDLTRETPATPQDGYDAITGNGILHHLYHHLDAVLPALYRWLRPGGRLIFWEPNLWNPYVWLIFSFTPLRHAAKLEPDEMAFTPGYIRRKLLAAGFTTARVTTRDFLLPNTPDALIRPVIAVSNCLDRLPAINRLAQSLFLVAGKPETEAADQR